MDNNTFDATDEIGCEESGECYRYENDWEDMEGSEGDIELTREELQEEADRMHRLDEAEHDMTDAEADADVLRSAGMGTDEDYGG